ncbi:low temperature requirement protein A [Nonomuraea sp. TT08I-71]|nr:low temperature requirement protein A [Nonomuraea sp. TT08I-71]
MGLGIQLISLGGPGTRVTRLELFYDLVFVFAFLNVTTLTSERPTAVALLEMFLVLAVLWWCWTGFAALGNLVRADQRIMPVVGLVVMAAVFVLALTTEVAFYDEPGGLVGPLVFATAYLVTWVVKMVAFWLTVSVPSPRQAALLTLPTMGGAAIILIAALLRYRLGDEPVALTLQMGLWILALTFEYLVGLLLVRTGWEMRSAGHLAERHGLIVLVALGESVIALGIGAAERGGRPITWWAIYAACMTLSIIFALWWLYFDTLALAMEQRLHGVRGPERLPLVRDVYTYLHLPLIAGIIVFALGVKRLLARLTDPAVPPRHDALAGLDIVTLTGGLVLYLLALVAMELRMFGRLPLRPLVGAVALAVSVAALRRFPALVALTVIGLIFAVLVLAQVTWDRDLRKRVRDLALEEQAAMEEEANLFRRRRL